MPRDALIFNISIYKNTLGWPTGIEPALSPSQGELLPLQHSHTKILSRNGGRTGNRTQFGLSSRRIKSPLPTHLELRPIGLVGAVGVEPTTYRVKADCSAS